jgi:hypothetical protein
MSTRALIAGPGMPAALPAAAHRGGPNIMGEEQLIRDAHRLRGIPGVIVQGRYDVGHAFGEPDILHRLIEATDAFAAAGPGGTPR